MGVLHLACGARSVDVEPCSHLRVAHELAPRTASANNLLWIVCHRMGEVYIQNCRFCRRRYEIENQHSLGEFDSRRFRA